MERIPIRLKVAATLAVPLLMLLLVSVLEVNRAAGELAEVRNEAQLARAVTGPSGVITRIFDERSWVVLELTGLEGSLEVPMEGYDETRAATDEALRAFQSDVERKGGAVEATFTDALDAVSSLADIRDDVDAFSEPRTLDNMQFSTDIYDRYSEVINAFLDATADITGQVSDTELRMGTQLAALSSQQAELDATLSQEAITAAMLSPNGIDTPAEINGIASLLWLFDRNNERIAAATGPYASIVQADYPTEYVQELRAIVTTALETGTIDDLDSYFEVLGMQTEAGYPEFSDAVFAAINDRADMLTDEASARQRVFVILAGVVFLAAAGMIWLVSRSITQPLRSLTRQAKDMAEIGLPAAVHHILETPPGDDVRLAPVETVTITTRDEIADLAAALNMAQESALKLAAEQAVLRRNLADTFVNLGRRNQNLLGRQLDFITNLESREVSPERLGGLFRLDHLATRMRRNAESLLVLAGIEPPRTWVAPVPIAGVVRAAVGEVEHYERVRLGGVEPALVEGQVVADLTHLLAELIENALNFSPPNDSVSIRGWWHDHSIYGLTIVDQGYGMPEADIAEANARLSRSEPVTVAPSRYLGHHVTGNLAARHGIGVQLKAGAAHGIVATVELPPQLASTPTGSQRTARTGTFL